MDLQLCYVVCASKEEARGIAKALIDERLAGCVNIIDNVESHFIWEGEYRTEREVILLAKTSEALVEDVMQCVHQHHSYECPCIVTLPLREADPRFRSWVLEHLQTP